MMEADNTENEICVNIIFEKNSFVSLEPTVNPKEKACKYFTQGGDGRK
jgi:hypothetical protein